MPFVPMSELTPRKTEFLWPGRLALGHLALFDGDPGLGKSLLTTDFVRPPHHGPAVPRRQPRPHASRGPQALKIRTMRVNPFTLEQESWWLLPEQKLPVEDYEEP